MLSKLGQNPRNISYCQILIGTIISPVLSISLGIKKKFLVLMVKMFQNLLFEITSDFKCQKKKVINVSS